MLYSKKVIGVGAFSAYGAVYGVGRNMPWSFAEDFKHFRSVTGAQSDPPDTTIVFGRHTWEDMPLIKNREIIVVSSDHNYVPTKGAIHALNVHEAIQKASHKNVILGGGKKIWLSAFDLADEFWVTIVGLKVPTSEGLLCMPEIFSLALHSNFHLGSARMTTSQPDRLVTDRKAALTFEHWVRKAS